MPLHSMQVIISEVFASSEDRQCCYVSLTRIVAS